MICDICGLELSIADGNLINNELRCSNCNYAIIYYADLVNIDYIAFIIGEKAYRAYMNEGSVGFYSLHDWYNFDSLGAVNMNDYSIAAIKQKLKTILLLG